MPATASSSHVSGPALERAGACTQRCLFGVGQLRTSEPAALRWCDQYHRPFFRPAPGWGGEPPGAIVEAVYPDPGARIELRTDGEPVTCHFGNRGYRVPGSGGSPEVHSPADRAVFVSSPGLCRVVCLERSKDTTRLPARIMREMLIALELSHGAVRLHASCVPLGGAWVLVIGDKGAGKSSIAFGALRAGEAAFCANDRLLVHVQQGRVVARGLPVAIKVPRDIVSWFPGLANVRAGQLAFAHQPRPALGGLVLTPTELSRLTGCRLTPSAEISAVLAPSLVRSARRSAMRALPPEERRALLAASVFNRDPAFPGAVIGVEPPGADPGTLGALLSLPWYELTGTFSDPGLITHAQEHLHHAPSDIAG